MTNSERVLAYLKQPGMGAVTALSIAAAFKWPEAHAVLALRELLNRGEVEHVGIRWRAKK